MRSSALRSRLLDLVVRRSPRGDEVRLGSGYGGWIVPDDLLGPGALCVTAGVGEDTTFDEALLDRGCRVHAVDPTPRALAHVQSREYGDAFTMHPVGLWNEDTELRFYAPSDPSHVSHSVVNLQRTSDYFIARVVRLGTLLDAIGVEHVDLLKLDIEGAEFPVLEDLLDGGLRPTVLCVEFDQPATLREMLGALRRLRATGYRLLARDDWNFTLLHVEGHSSRP